MKIPPVSIVTTAYGSERLGVSTRLFKDYPDAHADLLEWCREHGLDPNTIPSSELIEVHPTAREITFTTFDPDDFHRRIQHTTKPDRILPWPDSIKELA